MSLASSQEQVFHPASMAAAERARLDGLLEHIEALAAERSAMQKAAMAAALERWLSGGTADDGGRRLKEATAIYRSIPPDILQRIVEEFAGVGAQEPPPWERHAGTVAGFSFDRKLEMMINVDACYHDFIAPARERALWKQISKGYAALLKDFPGILCGNEDTQGAVRMGRLLKEEKGYLRRIWNRASGRGKLDSIKSLLMQAYPANEVDDLSMVVCDAGFTGMQLSVGREDIILCGRSYLKQSDYAFVAFSLVHEFQHVRQSRLAGRLGRNEIAQGGADHYRARLMTSNLKGGYLDASLREGLPRLAGLVDYYNQPVECEANGMAAIASMVGETGAAEKRLHSARTGRTFSLMARPVESVMYNVARAFDAARSWFQPRSSAPPPAGFTPPHPP